MTKLPLHTADKTDKNIAAIAALFPNTLTEVVRDGKTTHAIDFDMLRQELSSVLVEGAEERYTFNWPDKRQSVLLANMPNFKTLRPCHEESVNFDTTENLYIEGDNIEVLKLLQETYLGKVKMIYIDPPYNTGKDAFVYDDDFSENIADYNEDSGDFDEEGFRLYQNLSTNGRFHTDWLNMIYPRLKVAKDLLRDDGVIFISIDDNEVHNLRKMCDEVFGAWNFLAMLPRVTKKAGKTTDTIAKNNDFLLIYSKSNNIIFNLQSHTDEGFKNQDEFYEVRGAYKLNQTLDYDSLQYSPSLDYPIEIDGEIFYPGNSYEKYVDRHNGQYSRADWAWRWSKELFEFGFANGFIVVKKYDTYSRIYTKTYQNVSIEKTAKSFEIVEIERTKPLSSLEFVDNKYSNDNAKKQLSALFEAVPFDYSKPISLIKFLIAFATANDDICLDFFSGSATTAHAIMQLNAEDGGNRKFIMVQLPEVCNEKSEAFKAGYRTICDIGKERIRRAGKKILQAVTSGHGRGDGTGYGMGIDNLEEYQKSTGETVLDIGFRVLKIDSTNMKDVYYEPEEITQTTLIGLIDNIKDDRTPEDLLFQVMLNLGVLLSCKIEKEVVGGKNVFTVYNGGECYLIACFDTEVTAEVVTAIAKRKPYYAVFRDSGMSSDSLMTSFEQIFEAYSKSTVRRVL